LGFCQSNAEKKARKAKINKLRKVTNKKLKVGFSFMRSCAVGFGLEKAQLEKALKGLI